MKFLNIPFVAQEHYANEKLPSHAIDNEPWNPGKNLSCIAAFSISHFDEGIHLKFLVIEPSLRVKTRRINGEVHKDNCVEFFIAIGTDGGYYNFEFNCLGSVKAAYGKSRLHRKFLSPQLLKIVEDSICISMDNLSAGKAVRWEISIILPVSIFTYQPVKTLSGRNCQVNFAKCGDNLPNPHFLSWVPITADKPDFHQPAAFGSVIFEPKPVLTLA